MSHSEFTPCNNCTSPMACRDVGMCEKQYEDTRQSKTEWPVCSNKPLTEEERLAATLKEIQEHADRGQKWPRHAKFHLGRIEHIIEVYKNGH